MAGEIVPFGKYKGQPIEVLGSDAEYVEWLRAQPWFSQRYPNLNTIIINNFKEPSETPEHNALQARLLDEKFAAKILMLVDPNLQLRLKDNLSFVEHLDEIFIQSEAIKTEILKKLNEQVETYSSYVEEDFARVTASGMTWINREPTYYEKVLQEVREKIGRSDLGYLHLQVRPRSSVIVRFEVEGADAKIDYYCGIEVQCHLNVKDDLLLACNMINESVAYWSQKADQIVVRVELKPCLGDDYPAVLRQAVANDCGIVICERFSARGATFDEARKIFGSRNIVLAMLEEVEAIDFDPWRDVGAAMKALESYRRPTGILGGGK